VQLNVVSQLSGNRQNQVFFMDFCVFESAIIV